MGNIIGESFKGYVADQINQRQKALGTFNKDNSLIAYAAAEAPFIKLTSGVNLSPEKCEEIGIPTSFAGSQLASQFVLMGGVTPSSGTPHVGVANSYTPLIQQIEYGFASNSDYGLVPMPGIQEASVKSLNRGSLRECEISIKCHNKIQFNLIETLFLRLKYSFLLEFGHSVYYDNSGTLVTNPISNSKFYLKEGNTQKEVLDQLESSREASGGNYDAFLGFVKNFSWDIEPNGSYNITIKGITSGDVIESLKINVLKNDTGAAEEEDSEAPAIEKDSNKSTLNLIFDAIRQISATGDTWYSGEESIVTIDAISTPTLLTKVPSLSPLKGELKAKYSAYNSTAPNVSVDREAVRLEFSFDDSTTGEEQLYLKFGALCRFVESYCLMYDTGNSKCPPIISIDNDYDTNYCFTVPEQFSTDPRICMIPLTIDDATKQGLNETDSWWNNSWIGGAISGDTNAKIKSFSDAIGNQFRTSESFVGKLMHIHVNLNFVSQILSKNIDENGDISLYDFFSEILSGMQRAMGGINKFEVIYNEDTNSLRFMDNTQIPGVFRLEGKTPPIPTKLQTGLLKPNEGSFVTSVGIKSELTKEISNMMTIGAQSNGNVVGENATAFSRWNEGLTDRMVKEKQNQTENDSSSNNAAETKSPEEKFAEYQKNVLSYLVRMVRLTLDEDDIETYSTSFRPYLRYIVGTLENPKGNADPVIPPIGFIPISLDVQMSGLSGIKVYQKYSITEDYLPPNYQGKIHFLTKGVSHTITLDGWYTSIDGQTVPINNKATGRPPSSPTNGGGSSSGGSSSGGGNQNNPSTPQADRLRKAIKDAGFYEKGNELSNGGDITEATANYGIQLVKTVAAETNIKLTFTGGNDRYHQRVSYNSRHKVGRGLDFVISPRPPKVKSSKGLTKSQLKAKYNAAAQANIKAIEDILKGFTAANEQIRYLNEYYNPTLAATGPHFHTSVGKGSEGKQNRTNAIAEANAGLIKLRPLT